MQRSGYGHAARACADSCGVLLSFSSGPSLFDGDKPDWHTAQGWTTETKRVQAGRRPLTTIRASVARTDRARVGMWPSQDPAGRCSNLDLLFLKLDSGTRGGPPMEVSSYDDDVDTPAELVLLRDSRVCVRSICCNPTSIVCTSSGGGRRSRMACPRTSCFEHLVALSSGAALSPRNPLPRFIRPRLPACMIRC